ncbi:MAG TPA: ATP-binding protein [Candidatus Baltobacteraceae bacterium]|nr:ATP-binding protein [Candidatus Baltobacteraceae bacterium]
MDDRPFGIAMTLFPAQRSYLPSEPSALSDAAVCSERGHCGYDKSMVWTFNSADAGEALGHCTQFLTAVAREAAIPVDTFASSLIYSELVINVVHHAPGPIEISVAVENEDAVLRVADRGPGFALAPALPEDELAERGRGLFLVAKFAKDVSAGRDEHGHHYVRAVLPRAM